MTVLRVTVNFNMPESTIAQNVMCMLTTENGTASDSELLAAAHHHVGVWWASVRTVISDFVRIGNTTVHEVISGTPPTYRPVGEASRDAAGAVTGGMEPHGVAAMVRHLTPVARKYGRVFVPGIGQGQLTDTGVFLATLVSAVTAAAVVLDTPQTAPGLTFDTAYAVLSPSNGVVHATNGTLEVNDIPDYQRRRKPGVGV